MGLPAKSVSRPISVFMIFLAILLLSAIALTRLPVELMPNFSFGDITIFVNIRGGMPPTEVENRVTKPIEEAVGTVSHLRDIISISEEGRARIVMRFEPGIDMDFAALEVREKFSRVKNKLPPEIERPVIAKFEQSDVPIIILALTGVGFTPEDLRRIVEDNIKDKIQRVEGVANVDLGGGRERKILVEVDQHRLQALTLPFNRLIATLNLNNLNILLGDIKRADDKYLIRITGEFNSIEEIQNIGITTTPSGSIIRLKEIAEVKDSYLEASSYARVNKLPVVSIYIQKETTGNTVKIAEAVHEELDKIKPKLDPRLRLITTYNQAEGINKAITSVRTSLLYGSMLAILILFMFLRSFRSVGIIALSIPISVIITFGLMYFSNITLNVMTLSGLALGIGMLVDSSIVVLENIFKKKEEGLDIRSAAVSGAEEMFLAIIASTITTIVVFLPIVFVNKEIRILYSGLALTVSFSLIASLIVGISVVPVLSSLQFGKPKPAKPAVKKHKFLSKISNSYNKALHFFIRRRYWVIFIALMVFFISAMVYQTKLDKEFIGTTEPEDFTVFVELPTGAKLDISNEAVADVEAILAEIPEIKTSQSRIEPWSSKIYVKLYPMSQRKRSAREIIEGLRPQVEEVEKKYKEAFIYFEEQQAVETNEVIVDIYGYNYDTLNDLAVKMLSEMQKIEGLTDLKVRWRKGRPEWRLIIDKAKAAQYGFTVEDVAERVHAQMRGLRATLYHTEAKEIEVIARLDEKHRKTLQDVKKLTMVNPEGETVYLDQVMNAVPGLGPSKIWRKNKNRMIQISANRGKFAFGKAAETIMASVKDIYFPKDYHYRMGDNYWRMMRNQKELGFALLLVLILVYLVLASLFESYSQPFIIMMTVPLAAIGAVIALKMANKAVNIGVLIGAIMLGGIVVNNAIILIDYANGLRKKSGKALEAITEAAKGRLRPIAMTTSTTVLGLLPMAMDKSESSNLWSPLALTVIGGLLSSTILTLFVIPCTYMIFEDLRNRIITVSNFFQRNKPKPVT